MVRSLRLSSVGVLECEKLHALKRSGLISQDRCKCCDTDCKQYEEGKRVCATQKNFNVREIGSVQLAVSALHDDF